MSDSGALVGTWCAKCCKIGRQELVGLKNITPSIAQDGADLTSRTDGVAVNRFGNLAPSTASSDVLDAHGTIEGVDLAEQQYGALPAPRSTEPDI
jgi:hypothetical protein